MIVGDFDLKGIAAAPDEADSVLGVNPDTVLSLAVASQLLRAVAWRAFQIIQCHRRVQHCQFPLRNASWRRAARLACLPDFRRLPVGESLNHLAMITIAVNNVNRY